MPAGTLLNAHAYEVAPRQAASFQGGNVGADPQLEQQLNEAYDAGRLDNVTAVSLIVDPTPSSRTSHVREALRALAHGTATEAGSAALELAQRLGRSLDNRSKPCLLVASTHATSRSAEPRVVLWTFPRQSVFSLGLGGRRPKIRINQAFVRESYLRKAAVFSGGKAKTDFLTGRVLDKQALGTDRSVADLWISKFLEARLQMTPTEGTRLLARALRHAHDQFQDDPIAQSEIHAAILGIRASNAANISIDSIANQYLSPTVATAVRSVGRNDDAATAAFQLDKTLFDQQIQFRIYRLDNGVWVSAPFDQLGDGVTREGRRLTATGLVEEEQIRAQHR